MEGINAMEKSELTTIRYEEYNEQYQYPLGVALALLVIELLVLSRRNHRLRRFNVFSDPTQEGVSEE